MTESARNPNCPPWCPDNHQPWWSIHALNCGEVTLGEVTYSIDVVKYRDDEPELVSFCIYTADYARVGNYSPEQARRIHEALGTALALIANGQDAEKATTAAPPPRR